ncbi:EamA family transporter [Aquabacterium sp. J223]|uniref:EamA family transporter n=1 Tax=Aquabacterium sp. J223 TaxID=2898431 RepID=UPI0021ADA586|nr:EamA family transporter [Aquabacterium sp. J223]UUX96323.1 hypothetical protein LRS07_03090 [Aquabacterium sp. J223]
MAAGWSCRRWRPPGSPWPACCPPPRPQAALSLAGGLLLFGFLAGNLALQYGASRLPAQLTALVMLSEIVFAAVSAWAIDGAALTVPLLAGGALILAAGVLSARAPPAA